MGSNPGHVKTFHTEEIFLALTLKKTLFFLMFAFIDQYYIVLFDVSLSLFEYSGKIRCPIRLKSVKT